MQFRPNQNVPTVFRPGFPPLRGDVSPGSCLNKAFNKLNLLPGPLHFSEEKLFTWRSTQRTSPSSFTHKPQLVCSSRNEIIVNYMIMYCHPPPSSPRSHNERGLFACGGGRHFPAAETFPLKKSRAHFRKTHRKRGSKIKIKLIHFSATRVATVEVEHTASPHEFFRDCSGWWPKVENSVVPLRK